VDDQVKWPHIRRVFGGALRSSLRGSIATVDDTGRPNITPIGFLFLRDNDTTYSFEE
jgi:predicted pyridoxine 5'-phosphate oxidase superfamily flavin-nucleotide-binding protein